MSSLGTAIAGADDHGALVALVVEQIAAGRPPPFETPAPPPVSRRWQPGERPTNCQCRIVAAHPELGLPQISVLRSPRVSRSAPEGWRGRTYSHKARTVVDWNGRLVRAMILLADADASVTRLLGSPLTLELSAGGRRLKRTPHLLIVRDGEPWLIDCLWEGTAQQSAVEERSKRIGEACTSLGLGYEVLTERYLEEPTLIRNVEVIGRARQDPFPDDQQAAAIREMVSLGHVTVRETMEALSLSLRVLARLIIEGWLRVDLARPIEEAELRLGPLAQP